ncbi:MULTISPECIES: ABC-three component system protein [Pseudomonas]|uniref:Serine protease n=2 Tax=Pseudomonas putida TaxID=303 RepID=A0AAW6PWV5_PSEPU|nr:MULTISPECIES: ABC-three component system protein [Pseudomonas]MCE0879755.1 serine protease [Pseudomonas putida]MDF3873115.1 serine protease [Pseudomonas putida]MDF3879410.1 serine protease [Pseudomonas putida]GLO16776.1 hypothetical protein PPUJ20188_01690 [Pseudomonas putida]
MKLDTNKTVSEIMQSYCVMVNGGSGVLMNAMTLEFSYVLTARHTVFEEPAKNVVTDHNQNAIEVLGVMVFPKVGQQEPLDCAILKIAHQAGLSQKSWTAANLPPMANLTFVGLPNAERASATPIKHRTGQAASVVNDLITLELAGIPSKEVIQGMSGGGVYHIDDDCPYLVGVEFEMEATCLDHQYGRVECHGLARYNQLLTLHSSAPMVPPHLECFSRMRDRIFAFNVYDPINVQNLKSALLAFADSLIKGGMPPPYEIMTRYDTQLLLDSGESSVLEARELWVAYLEFVVISAIMDGTGSADNSYISGIDKKRRLLYTADSTNWLRRLDEILKIARKLLDKDGTLVVASPDIAAKPVPKDFMLKNVIGNIAVVPGKPFSIDEVESEIYTSYKLTHLEGLRNSCVIEREDEYRNLAPGNIQLLELRKNLDEIIN